MADKPVVVYGASGSMGTAGIQLAKRHGAHVTAVCSTRGVEVVGSLGADGVMIIPPFYSTPTEDELFHHYKAVGEALAIPIMIYNNPATASALSRISSASSRNLPIR